MAKSTLWDQLIELFSKNVPKVAWQAPAQESGEVEIYIIYSITQSESPLDRKITLFFTLLYYAHVKLIDLMSFK